MLPRARGKPARAAGSAHPRTTDVQLFLFDTRWREAPFSRDADAQVLLRPVGDGTKTFGEATKAADGRIGIRLTKIERPFLDQFAKATSLAVAHDGQVVAEIPTPGTARALAALRECEASALKDWGLDSATMMSLRSYPKPTGGSAVWIVNEDYPDEAIRNNEAGTVVALLKVGADGVATGCAIVDSSGSKTLDNQTCAIFGRRARYDPAIDATGKPVIGLAAVRIRWVMP
jgi:TonB family protein